jgi:hypothetical protein
VGVGGRTRRLPISGLWNLCSPPSGLHPALLKKYRGFTGRRCVPNTGKVIEVAKEKARVPNRRGTGAKNRRNRQLTGGSLLFRGYFQASYSRQDRPGGSHQVLLHSGFDGLTAPRRPLPKSSIEAFSRPPGNTIRTCNIEFDSTVFRFAPNEPNHDRCPCRHCVFGCDAAPLRGKAADRSRAVQGLPSKNTGDLQWEMRANCNASPCVNERNVAGPGTMGINGKTMRSTMETMKIQGRDYVRL